MRWAAESREVGSEHLRRIVVKCLQFIENSFRYIPIFIFFSCSLLLVVKFTSHFYACTLYAFLFPYLLQFPSFCQPSPSSLQISSLFTNFGMVQCLSEFNEKHLCNPMFGTNHQILLSSLDWSKCNPDGSKFGNNRLCASIPNIALTITTPKNTQNFA